MLDNFLHYLDTPIYGLTLRQLLMMILVISLAFVFTMAARWLLGKLTGWAENTESEADDLILSTAKGPLFLIIWFSAFYGLVSIWNPDFPSTYHLFGLTIQQHFGILFVCIAAVISQRLSQWFIKQKLVHWTSKTETRVDDLLVEAIKKPLKIAVFAIAAFLIVSIWDPQGRLATIMDKGVELGFLAAIFLLCLNSVDILVIYFKTFAKVTDSEIDDQLVPIISKGIRIFIWVIGTIMVVQNLGYSVSGLLATLGVGSVAIAFAAQDTIANVFGSIKVLIDGPFKIGDWIKAGDQEGVVEDIGFFSTKIRTFKKSLITVPNNTIANTPIENFSRMTLRRIATSLGVTYSTTTQQLRDAVDGINKLLENHPGINQDFFMVKFDNFGPSSLDIFLYFFTNTTDWAEWIAIKEELFMAFMELFEELGIEFAFPSQSLYVESIPQKDEVMQEILESARNTKAIEE